MKKSERRMIILFVTPVVIAFLIFFLYPTVRTVYMSFFKMTGLAQSMSEWSFAGLQNYLDLFKNPLFVKSYGNIFKIAVLGGIATFIVALFFAVTLSANFRGRKTLRAIVYLPNIITPVALVTMWNQYIFNNEYGLLHEIFSFLHLDFLADIPWTSTEWSFPSMMIAYCFGCVGYYMIIYLSAMEKIPDDYYDYASLEGAGKFYMFRRITMPLLRDTTRTAVTFWLISSINFFLWSRVFNVNPLEPETLAPANLMFSMAFGTTGGVATVPLNVGGACAVGVLLTITVVLAFALVNFLGGKERYEY